MNGKDIKRLLSAVLVWHLSQFIRSMLFNDTIPSNVSIEDYRNAIHEANKKLRLSFRGEHHYLVLAEDILKEKFGFSYISIICTDDYVLPHIQELSLLGNKNLHYFDLLNLLYLSNMKMTVIEIDSMYAKAERMASLYQTSVKALFCRASEAAIKYHPPVNNVGLEYKHPYLLKENDCWSLIYVPLQFKVKLGFNGKRRLLDISLKSMDENGNLKKGFNDSVSFPFSDYSDCYEFPRSIFLSLIDIHKSYCESILSLALDYICPPSTTFDIYYNISKQ